MEFSLMKKMILLPKPVVIVGEMTQVVLTIRRPRYRTPSMLHFDSSCKLGR
jgi:hypothetical protein